jgi:endonuclease/exonuclease/phosphatase (EEP) superfamily protein YafD
MTVRAFLRGWLLPAAALPAALLFALGLGLRLADYDGHPVLLAVRYATPWPVLAALAFGAGVLLQWSGRGRAATGCLFAAVACLCAWWQSSHRDHPAQHAPRELRVAYWNAARPPARAHRTADYAASLDADLLGLGETGASSRHAPVAWRERFADRAIAPLGSGMMLVARGSIEVRETGSLGGPGQYGVAVATIDGVEWPVILVDLFAIPWYPRQPAFDRLQALVRQYASPRLIVMGDFNTPGDAPATDVLRHTMHDAFESAGHGWAETWPVPFPVLSLDHIWLSRELRALRCEHGWSWLSDHRPVIATVAP